VGVDEQSCSHFALKRGIGISEVYATTFDRLCRELYFRHRRHGRVFQNRYKSIVCDGDNYFTELVRYIHLNPLRVELVKDLKELENYPYCGHGTILGTPARQWQDCESVLAQFGTRTSEAKRAYWKFVAYGENDDSSFARGELRSSGCRYRSPSGNLDLRRFEDSDENFVYLVNSVPMVFY